MKNAGLGEKITSYPLVQPLALGLSCHMLLQVKTLGQQELEVLCSVISGHFLVWIMKWALVCVSQTKILMDWTGFCTIFSLQTAIEVDIVLYLFIDNLKLGLVVSSLLHGLILLATSGTASVMNVMWKRQDYSFFSLYLSPYLISQNW